MKSGAVYVCFQGDFLIEEADDACHFIFLTKRIDRFEVCRPANWEDGYEHVKVGVSCENQQTVDERLPILSQELHACL